VEEVTRPLSGEASLDSLRRPRAVIDTSVLFVPRLRATLQELALEGAFTALWSPWIIAELNRVLVWQWITERTGGDLSRANQRKCSQAAKKMMTLLLGAFEVVNPRPPYPMAWEQLTDLGDHPVWAAAVQGHAQYVVSNNTQDYPPRQPDGRYSHQGIEYMSRDDFVALVLAD
jgi:hypothetical protein